MCDSLLPLAPPPCPSPLSRFAYVSISLCFGCSQVKGICYELLIGFLSFFSIGFGGFLKVKGVSVWSVRVYSELLGLVCLLFSLERFCYYLLADV